MKKILFLDATVRSQSRTKQLASYLLEKLEGTVEHLVLNDTALPALTDTMLAFRDACCAKADFRDVYFDYAKQFAAADTIVIAAPFWDNSFPAVLKKYVETISVVGLTFRYQDNGVPVGLCKAQTLYYVTTAGGVILNDVYGYGYIGDMAIGMYGIPETYLCKAEGLDIWGADCEAILGNARREIDRMLAER